MKFVNEWKNIIKSKWNIIGIHVNQYHFSIGVFMIESQEVSLSFDYAG